MRVSKQHLRDTLNSKHPKRAKKAKRALKKLNTNAGRLFRELERNLSAQKLEQYYGELEIYRKALNQERSDKDKIYSLTNLSRHASQKGSRIKSLSLGTKQD